jgi:large subunit ribosomal protein L22
MVKVKAKVKWVRVAPRKARIVIDLVRGKECTAALNLLSFMPNKAAAIISDVVKSAVANAKHNYKLDGDLFISEAMVDEAAAYKRWQPQSKGRAHPIKKRNSHITVCVSPAGEEK